ncbi:hypothetical protein PQX77_013189 [Marasmius sp. AFHP31]|nr:hypothetical protein PQX77_013189 [Marasmius sp. AFHP31]
MQHSSLVVFNVANSTFSLAQEDITMYVGDEEHERTEGLQFDAERMGENSVDLSRARNPNLLQQETPNSEMNKRGNELQDPQTDEMHELAEVEKLCLDNVDENDIGDDNDYHLETSVCVFEGESSSSESSFGPGVGIDTQNSSFVDGGLMDEPAVAVINLNGGGELAGLDTQMNEANVTVASSDKRQDQLPTAPNRQLLAPVVKQEDLNSPHQTLISITSRSANLEHHDTQKTPHKRRQRSSRKASHARILKQTTHMENYCLCLRVKKRDTQLSKAKARLRTASDREFRFQSAVQRRDTRIAKLVDEHTRTQQAFGVERTEDEARIRELDPEVERLREEAKKAKATVSRLTRNYRTLETTHREGVIALARVRDELASCEGRNKALNDALARTRESLEAEKARSQRYREERTQLDEEFEVETRECQRVVDELEAARESLADWSEAYDQRAEKHVAAEEAWRRERKEYKRLLAQRERELEDTRANLQRRKRH